MVADGALAFAFDAPPAAGTRRRVADGVDWVRQPLPFALDHVNCWVFGAKGAPDEPPGDDVTLVDTGIASERGRSLWHETLGGACPARVLVTHFHPDHMGLAGEFAADGSALLGSAVETSLAHRIWHTGPLEYGERYADWYAANGLPEESVEHVRAFGNGYRKIVAAPPAPRAWRTLAAGDVLTLGEREFRVLVGRGHAPDMLLLHDAANGLLIAADQVLPTISPNVSIMPLSPDPDPLASFLASLDALRELPADTLVLPSHGLPFRGLHARLDALVAHHAERLAALRDAVSEPRSAFELFPVLFRRTLDAQQMSFALGETLAHLARLAADGQVSVRTVAGVERWRRR